MDSPDHERRAVIDYWKGQSPEDADVTHAEKIAAERVYGRTHDVWDVHATDGRWWVITNPTNLYSQDQFPSMDYALSFHLGLMQRVMAKNQPNVDDEQEQRLARPWRLWVQAADALNEADEAEEFQAVGMRCRECLLALVREAGTEDMVPPTQTAPKRGDFVHWAEFIADAVASGPAAARIRAYLRSTAKTTWELVQWLTHEQDATRLDAMIAVDATQNVLGQFGMAVVRFERGAPARCPQCSSYRLAGEYKPEAGTESAYVTFCEACGWRDER